MKHFFIPNPKLSSDEVQYAIDERLIKIESIIACLYASCDACVPVGRNTSPMTCYRKLTYCEDKNSDRNAKN